MYGHIVLLTSPQGHGLVCADAAGKLKVAVLDRDDVAIFASRDEAKAAVAATVDAERSIRASGGWAEVPREVDLGRYWILVV